jgi:hypothetical protein
MLVVCLLEPLRLPLVFCGRLRAFDVHCFSFEVLFFLGVLPGYVHPPFPCLRRSVSTFLLFVALPSLPSSWLDFVYVCNAFVVSLVVYV